MGLNSEGKLLALSANIHKRWKWLTLLNIVACFSAKSSTIVKKKLWYSLSHTSGANVIKHFMAVGYKCLQQARVFSLSNLSSLV
jgi:hypothetical protein